MGNAGDGHEEKICPKCGGHGTVLVKAATKTENETWARCSCSFARTFKARCGIEIATAVPVTESPLYVPKAPGEPPLVDKTKTNMFLKGWWGDLVSHFRFVFIWKQVEYNLNYYIQIVTDERLKNVWVGNEAYDKRSRKKRDEMATFNSLSDLIGADQHLVIIRLGSLTTHNRAMAGILKEALLIRQSSNMPTWVVETPDSIYGPGHFSYSEDTADYIHQRFEIMNLTRTRDTEIRPRGVEGAEIDDEPGMAMDREDDSDGPQRPVKMPRERFSAPSVFNDEAMPYSKQPKRNKRGNGGSDIV